MQLYLTRTLSPHFDTLHNVLARCVLVRERPEWWSSPGPEDDEEG